MDESLQKFIHARVKEYLNRRYEQQDNLILEYLLANPELSANDIELVEQRIGDGEIIWYCRKREAANIKISRDEELFPRHIWWSGGIYDAPLGK